MLEVAICVSLWVPPTLAKPTARKPSGPVTYLPSQGANVRPSMASRDEALFRVLNGELVVVRKFLGRDKVAVNVGGRDRVLTRAEWRSLPVYEG